MIASPAAPLSAERSQAPVIVLDALEHTPFHLSPKSGYQIVEHPAIKEVLLFRDASYCGEFDSVEAAQAYVESAELVRQAVISKQAFGVIAPKEGVACCLR